MLSPQSTLVETMVPSGSETVMDNMMLWPVLAVEGEGVKLTTGGLSPIVT
jgi:hypothetical protein